MTMRVDVTANRRARNYGLRVMVARVLWAAVQPLFRFSPRIFWLWRVWLLRAFGARIGRGVHIYPTVRIAMPWALQVGDQAAVGDRAILYNLGPLQIGARATVSQNAHLCGGTHDLSDPARPLVRAPVVIGADAWVCADAFVGPGVTIGEGAVLGARAVAMKSLPPRHLGLGNPMQIRTAAWTH